MRHCARGFVNEPNQRQPKTLDARLSAPAGLLSDGRNSTPLELPHFGPPMPPTSGGPESSAHLNSTGELGEVEICGRRKCARALAKLDSHAVQSSSVHKRAECSSDANRSPQVRPRDLVVLALASTSVVCASVRLCVLPAQIQSAQQTPHSQQLSLSELGASLGLFRFVQVGRWLTRLCHNRDFVPL